MVPADPAEKQTVKNYARGSVQPAPLHGDPVTEREPPALRWPSSIIFKNTDVRPGVKGAGLVRRWGDVKSTGGVGVRRGGVQPQCVGAERRWAWRGAAFLGTDQE